MNSVAAKITYYVAIMSRYIGEHGEPVIQKPKKESCNGLG